MGKKYNLIPHLDYKVTVVYIDDFKKITKTFNNDRECEKFVTKLQNRGYNQTYIAL